MLTSLRRTASRLRKRRSRPLQCEALEQRRVLATFMVTNLDDGPVGAPGDRPGSLRQALFDASNNPSGTVLFSENWDDMNGATRWSDPIIAQENTGIDFDGSVDYAFDYSVMGISPAPNSVGATTIGVALETNTTEQSGAPEGESVGIVPVSALAAIPAGDFRLTADVYLYWNGLFGTTEYGTLGAFSQGNDVPLRYGVSAGDGLAWQWDTDGDAIDDMFRFENPPPNEVPLGRWEDICDSVPGVTCAGAGNQWTEMELTSIGGMISFKVNGYTIDSFDNSSGQFSTGKLLLGQSDPFSSVNPPNASGFSNLAIFDNIVLETTMPDMVVFEPGLEGTIDLAAGELTINDNVVVVGPDATDVTINAGGSSRVVSVNADAELRNLGITGGQASAGGGIYSTSRLSLDNVTVTDNQSTGSGGGVYAKSDLLTVEDSVISGNSTTGTDSGGGGIMAKNGLAITDSQISGNLTSGQNADGGGIHAEKWMTMSGSTVSNNRTSGWKSAGGGILARQETTITNSVISGNATLGDDSDGGGIYAGSVFDINWLITITDTTISDNYTVGAGSSSPGGGIFSYSDLMMTRATVTGNHTRGDGGRGGGLFASGTQLATSSATIIDSTFSGNYTLEDVGAGIYSRYSHTYITDSVISNNWGSPAIWNFKNTMTIERSDISDNLDTGIRSQRGTLMVNDSTITGNSTGLRMGTNAFGQQYAYISNSTISGNTNSGIFTGDTGLECVTTIEHSTITENGTGVLSFEDPDSLTRVRSSLIAGNTTNDVRYTTYAGGPNTFVSLGYNLVGTGNAVGAFNNNDQTNIADPVLGPLAHNGGPTRTHALLSGSPAIDAGDHLAMPGVGDVPFYDQRGEPSGRVEDGDDDLTRRIDIGAFEVQPSTGHPCDFDGVDGCDIKDIDALITQIVAETNNVLFDVTGDGFVNLADRDRWLQDAGALNLMSGNAYLLGDSTLDGVVDGQDFLDWNAAKFTSTGIWSGADWNADGITDGQDFLLWNQNKFQSSDTQAQQAIRRVDAIFAVMPERDERSEDEPQAVVFDALIAAVPTKSHIL